MNQNDLARSIRERYIPLPGIEKGYSSVMLVGTTGAGKTTLLRHLIGSDPNRDRFPSTSTAKTTIAEIEIVTAPGPFKAVVTFAAHDEVLGNVQECIEAACEAVVRGGDDPSIASALLEHSEQRFRMSYLLGSWEQAPRVTDEDDDEDYEDHHSESTLELHLNTEELVGAPEIEHNNARLRRYVHTIRALAIKARQGAAVQVGDYDDQKQSDRPEWFADFFQPELRRHDEYANLVSDILREIERRFELVAAGSFDGTDDLRLELPDCWSYESSDRDDFLKQVRWFSSNHHEQFGRLLTPLVNGVRVQGPLYPSRDKLRTNDLRLVLLDGEGLGHSAKDVSSISTKITDRFRDVDLILLVDNAAQPMQAAPLRLLQDAGTSGHGDKLAVVFTHFDQVSGDNLRRRSDKLNHVKASLTGAMTGLSGRVSPRISETLTARLSKHAFYLGALNRPALQLRNADTEALRELMDLMRSSGRLPESINLLPTYNFDRFDDLALNDATGEFKLLWEGRLGLREHAEADREHWARIKALCRRIGIFRTNEYNQLKPVADLMSELQTMVSAWLEEPESWTRPATAVEENAVIDRIRSAAFRRIRDFAEDEVVETRRDDWERAYEFRGTGSTKQRAHLMVDRILEPAAPTVRSRSRRAEAADDFRDRIRTIVREAVDEVAISREEETHLLEDGSSNLPFE